MFQRDIASIRNGDKLTAGAVDTCISLLRLTCNDMLICQVLDTPMVSALQSAASRRDSEAAKRIEEKNDLKADRFVGPVYDGTSHWAAFQVNTFRHAELYTSYSGIGDQAFKHGIHGVCTALAMVIPQWGPAKQPPLIKPKCP